MLSQFPPNIDVSWSGGIERGSSGRGNPSRMLGMGQMGCSGEIAVNRPSQETYESVEVITVRFHDGLNVSSFHADYKLLQISSVK